MTVRGKGTYGQEILRKSYDALQPAIDNALREAERRVGTKLKITDIALQPVAEEHREVYDVFLTFVPDISSPVPAPTPEASNAGV